METHPTPTETCDLPGILLSMPLTVKVGVSLVKSLSGEFRGCVLTGVTTGTPYPSETPLLFCLSFRLGLYSSVCECLSLWSPSSSLCIPEYL